jgi:hypothetical protein
MTQWGLLTDIGVNGFILGGAHQKKTGLYAEAKTGRKKNLSQ